MSRKIRRSPERITAHNEKWRFRYRQRAALRDKYPDEFAEIRHQGHSYFVALRLIEEAHQDEVQQWVPPHARGTGRMHCGACGHPLRDHSIQAGCP